MATSLIVSPTNRQLQDIVCCITFKYSCNSVTQDDLIDIYSKLEAVIKSPYLNLANATIPLISKQIRLDSQNKIHNQPQLIKSIIKHFNRLAELLTQNKNNQESIHCVMLSILSIITQIIHNCPDYQMPFNRSFVQNLFMINTSLLESSERRKDIIRVMAVIFSDLSKRISILKELGLLNRFKQILLQSLRIIEDKLSFLRIYKSLCKVCLIIPLAMKEIVKYRVYETFKKFSTGESVRLMQPLQVKKYQVDSIIVDPNLANDAKLSQT